MSINALACSAMQFLQTHENEHLAPDLPLLVDRCIAHLVEVCGVSQPTAQVATLQAQGELSARHSKASIDCTRTTSFTLFLNDEQGRPVVVTVAELARLVKDARPLMRLTPG
jgi:hypothetical protein